MSDESWAIQVSLKAGSHMLNVRGANATEVLAHLAQFFRNDQSAAEFVALQFLEALDTDAVAKRNVVSILGATETVAAPVAETQTVGGFVPQVVPQPAAPAAPAAQTAPACNELTLAGTVCGAVKTWKEGVSRNTGKPYAFWACPDYKAHR